MGAYEDFLEKYGKGAQQQTETGNTPSGLQSQTASPAGEAGQPSSYDEFLNKYGGVKTSRQQEAQSARTNPARPQRPQGTEAPSAVQEEQPAQPARQWPVPSLLRPGREALIQDDTAPQQAQTPQKSFASDPFGYLLGQSKQVQRQAEEAKQPSDPTAEAGRGKTLPGGQRMETIEPGRLTQESGAEDYSKQTLGKIAGHGAYAVQNLEPKMPEATGPARGAGLRQLEEYDRQWNRREEARRAAAEPKDLTAIYNQANADYEALSRDIEALEAEIPRLEEELRVNGQYYGPEWEQDLERKRQQLEAERAQLEEARNAREAAFLALPEEQREQMNRNFIQRAWAAVQSGTERAVATFGRVGWQAIDGLFGRGGVVDTVLGGIPWGAVDGIVEIWRDITGSDDTSMVDPLGDLAARASNTAGQYEAKAAARLQYESDPVKSASDILYNAEIMLPYLLLVKASGGTSIIGGTKYAGAGTTAGLEYLSSVESAGSSWAAARMAFGETVRLMAHDAGAQWTWLTQFAESAATAREEGADGLEILTYALTNASVNTLVEMGGGLQRNLGEGLRALRPDKLARTMLEESGEEELQHFFENGLKQVYKNVELYSEENPEALINPDVMTQIFIDTALTTPFIVLEGAAVDRFDYRRRARVEARNQATANEIEANLESATEQDSDEALIAALEEIGSNRRLSRVFEEMYKTSPQEAIESIRQSEQYEAQNGGAPSVTGAGAGDTSLGEGGKTDAEAKPYTAVDALTGVDPRARQSGAEERIAPPATQSPVRYDEGTEGRNATEPSAPGHDAVSAQEAAGAPLAQGGTEAAGQGAQARTEQAPVLNSNEGAENKTAPVGADESTVVNTNPAQHTAAEQRVIDEYQDAVDETLVSYIETVQNNPGAKLGRYSLKPVNDRAAADIQKITGVNVTGNKTAIEPRIVEHILKDHGPAGRTDQSMRDVNDIGRIQYVLDNYDSVSDGGTTKAYQTVKGNGLPGQAKTVVFEKAVNGTYYVVEAVPDTKAKTLFVVSAYMSKKSPGAQQTADANASRVTSETKNADTPGALEAPASNSNIARLPANINTQNAPSQQNIDNTANPAYNNTEKTAGGNTNVEGRSAEEAGRGVAPGEGRLGAQYQSGDGSGRGPESAGIVRVNPELQQAYEKSGVVDYGLRDSSGDSAAYSSALEEGRSSDPKHGWMVTPQKADELQGKTQLLAPDNSEGVVVAKNGDIEGVFKNQNTGKPGALMRLLPQAVAAGGTKLDCYGEGLVFQYAPYGFIPVARVEFNEKYANPGWDPSKGRPYVYVMMHDGSSPAQMVENKTNKNYHKWTMEELDALPTYDKNGYDDATAYRDSLMQERAGQAAAPTTQAPTEAQSGESGLALSGQTAVETPGDTPSVTAAGRGDSSLAEGATGETGLAPRDPTSALRSAQDDTLGETGEGRIATEPPAPRNDTSGQKRSKTESHTEQHIAGRLGGEQEAVYYTPKSERESLTNAINRVNSDYNGEVQRLSDKPMWTGEDIDTALTIYGFLQMDGVRTGDFSAAQAWGRLVSARGTESGRALQAFSKWTRTGAAAATQSMERLLEAKRLSEEDRTRITNDVYNFAQEYDSIEDGDFGSLRDLIKRQARYRNTWTFLPKEFERMLNEETDFDWLKEYALRQMMNISADFTEQADLGQKVKTWQVNAQLSRLGTFYRNLLGNAVFGVQDTVSQDFFGVALDALVGKMTGKRTLSMDKGWLSSEARRGARRGMVRSILEVAGDVDMSAGGSKYGQSANRTFKMTGGGFSRMMSRWEQALGYSLTTSDRTFRGGIEAEQLRGLSQFENLTEEERQQLAENMADYRLFQNQGLAYRFMKGFHDVGNVLGFGGKLEGTQRKGGFGAADLVIPYPGVPANLWAKALEYSPANIVKGGGQLLKLLYDAKTGKDWNITRQQNAVMNVARGLHGAGLVALLAAMFSAGIIYNADDEDDKDVLALLSALGRQGVQINLSAGLRWLSGKDAARQDGDLLMKIDWLEPMNAFMAIAALAADEDDFPGYAGATLEGSLQAVLDMPLMENIANIVDTYNYSKADSTAGKLIDTAVGFGADALTGLLPAPLSQTARAMDPYYRETVGDDPLDTAKRRLFNTIPGLRQTLPEKLDNFGRPKEQAESAYNRWMNSFVRPGQISDYKTDDMQQEMEDFIRRTGDKDAVPARKAPNSFGQGENQITMTADERRLYQQVYGQSCEELYSSILLGDDYKDLSDGEKQWLLEQARDYATHQAKQAVLSGRGESREDKTWDRVDRVAKAGVDPVDYLLGKKQADRDEDGSTSKREVFDWLFTSDYTNAQKRAIWKETGGTDGSSWDQYRDNHPAAILASYKIDGDRAIAIATEINGGKTDWNGVKDLSSDELYAYYRKHPEQERYVKRLYDKKGLSESWDELKASQEKTPVNILVYGHGYSQKDAERLWKDINTNGGNVTQAEFYAFYRNHPELRDELEDIWKSKWPKTDIGRYRPR